MNIITIAGSLRKSSFNRGLLRAAAELAPEGVTLADLSYRDIPPFDGDVAAAGSPESVEAFKAAIAAADGLLIATPEFNYSVPGVLKNAIDWASRPAYASVFARKPVAIVSASPSAVGGARAQGQLKQNLLGIIADIYPAPEFAMGGARAKFDAEGRLADDPTRELLTGFLGGFVEFVDRRRA